MIEALADVDETIMEKYLSGEDISADEISAALRKGTLELKLTPVICGTAFKNKGVQLLLDAIVDYLPSPLDIPPVVGISPDVILLSSESRDDRSLFLPLHSR